MPAPNYSRYISPEERAANRARIRRFVFRSIAALAAFIVLMLYAYTDQAPAWLRNLAFQIDGAFGYPILGLILTFAA